MINIQIIKTKAQEDAFWVIFIEKIYFFRDFSDENQTIFLDSLKQDGKHTFHEFKQNGQIIDRTSYFVPKFLIENYLKQNLEIAQHYAVEAGFEVVGSKVSNAI